MLIIPDRDMPSSCTNCPCFQLMDHRAFCMAKKNIRGEVYEMNPHKVQGGRTEWCPLTEKPPKPDIDFWDFLIGKVIPVSVALAMTLIAALLIKLLVI